MTAPETAAPTSAAATAGQGWTADDSTFAARLALVRQRMGWNMAEAARECGLDRESWRLWEQGRNPTRFVTIALAIATRTGCDIDWLVYGRAKGLIQPSQSGGKVNVDYPRRLGIGERVLPRGIGTGANVTHGDGRRRPNGGVRPSGGRATRPPRMVSRANHTAPSARIPVA